MNLCRRGIGGSGVGSGEWGVGEESSLSPLPTPHSPLPAFSPGVENRGHHDFAERDFAVISLDHDRPRLALIAVERAAGDAVDHDVVMNLLAVEDDCQAVADDGGFHGLPLALWETGVDRRFDSAVESHVSVNVGRFTGVIQHLQLVTPAQEDAAVALLFDLVFALNLEIIEAVARD